MSLRHKKTVNMVKGGDEPHVEKGFSTFLKQLRNNPRLKDPCGFANNKVRKPKA